MSAAAIETRGLGKRYGKVHALEDLSLRVEEGEVFGFLGPNGAGKTTTIRLLLGLLRPSAGGAEVLGRPAGPSMAAVRGEVGYLPGELALWPAFTGAATLDFLARLSARVAEDRARLLERLDLGTADLGRPVRSYSDGMKQKLGIVQALQCRPRLALLDEPTKGLDPLVQQEFYAVLEDARRHGTTIFFSSHVLSEVERVCDRVAMLRGGRLVSVGTVEELRRAQRRRVVAVFSQDVDGGSLAHFGEIVEREPRRVALHVAQADLPALVARLGMLPLVDLVVEPPSLEEIFLERYR
ncbi:MAG: ABC transporter ATP-binding protein [Gemmatimonadetes bacterium]|nr:ABC transporter ATP-binding protein [Gemmatimonadota bacterium]